MQILPSGLRLNADQASGELCRRSLSRFVREFWHTVVSNNLVWNWHMDILCDAIQAADERVFKRLPKLSDLIINVPPGTSKTKITSVLSTAWEFACVPSIRVFVGSYSDGAVTDIADDIQLVMRSEQYARYFPKTQIRKDRGSLHNFRTTERGQFFAFTVGGTLTSKHADILKVDDPINPKSADTDVGIANANFFFDRTLPSRKIDKAITPTYLIMQRLATKDPTGHLLEKKGDKIQHICLPGTDGPQVKPASLRSRYIGGLLDPIRLPQTVLDEMRTDLGAAGYAGQFDQLPTPEGGLIWKEWFIPVPDEYFPPERLLTQYGTDWDLAYTSDEKNAASAYVTAGKLQNNLYIDDIGWDWLEFPDLIAWMKTKKGTQFIEAKASGKSAQQVLSKAGINAVEVAVQGGADKVARANLATPPAQAKRVFIRASLIDRLYNDSKQGILQFPKGPYKDLADALAQSIQRLDKNSGFSAGGGSDGEDEDLEDLD